MLRKGISNDMSQTVQNPFCSCFDEYSCATSSLVAPCSGPVVREANDLRGLVDLLTDV